MRQTGIALPQKAAALSGRMPALSIRLPRAMQSAHFSFDEKEPNHVEKKHE